MKKFKDLPFYKQVTLVYFYSFACSLLASPLFGKLYIIIFHPRPSSGLFVFPSDPLALSNGTIIGFIFFLSFLSFFLLRKRNIAVWLAGFILPFFPMMLSGLKDVYLAFFLSVSGWVLAKIMLRYKNNNQNSK